MRIYVPSTLAELADFATGGGVPAGAERFVAGDADEDSEYLALMSAADASRERGAARRVVIVAEVDDEDGPAPQRTWVAVHADTDDGAGADDEPGWFAVQELPALLGGR